MRTLRAVPHHAWIASRLAAALAVLAACAAPAASAPPPASDPKGIAREIYATVAAGDGDAGGQLLWTDRAVRARLFSKGLASLWAKADTKAEAEKDGLGAIDFDPLTASQDPLVRSFSVAVEKQDERSATVAVTLVDPRGRRKVPADETVRLDFVREGGRWAIDDLRGTVEGRRWSVREVLKAYLAP